HIMAATIHSPRGTRAMPLLMCQACEIYFASDDSEQDEPLNCPRCAGPTRPAMAIPPEEIETITLTLSDALDYAAAGKQAVGYALLIQGMTRAESLLTDGRAWGGELLRAWRAAI